MVLKDDIGPTSLLQGVHRAQRRRVTGHLAIPSAATGRPSHTPQPLWSALTTACASAGLHSEALAYLDLLVLLNAQHFVGFGLSTFSWAVLEYRCLLRRVSPTSTSMPAVSMNPWMDLSASTVLSEHAVTCPEAQPHASVELVEQHSGQRDAERL